MDADPVDKVISCEQEHERRGLGAFEEGLLDGLERWDVFGFKKRGELGLPQEGLRVVP